MKRLTNSYIAIELNFQKENEMKTRRDSVTQNIDQNSVDCHCPAVEIPESTGSMDVNFLPGEDFLNDFLMPDTRIFASLLNKDLNNSKINNINVTNANNGAKKTYADLTYKTVMIGKYFIYSKKYNNVLIQAHYCSIIFKINISLVNNSNKNRPNGLSVRSTAKM